MPSTGAGRRRWTTIASQILRPAARIESMAKDLHAELAVTFVHQPFLREMFERLHGRHAKRSSAPAEVDEDGVPLRLHPSRGARHSEMSQKAEVLVAV